MAPRPNAYPAVLLPLYLLCTPTYVLLAPIGLPRCRKALLCLHLLGPIIVGGVHSK